MKKILVLVLLSGFLHAQTYQVGHMSVNFKDASRAGGYTISGGVAISGSGRTVGTEVYYPANTMGENTPIATTGQFPVVVFGHGFAMAWSSYDNIYNRLASLGYMVMLPRTEGGTLFPSPNHDEFGKDLKFIASQGLLLNTINTPTVLSMFNGKIIQKSAIGGHSMGAGASFLATANNTITTCLFNFSAATTNNTPNSIAQASLVTIPALIISGEKDNVADTSVQRSHYNQLNSLIKFHTIIKDVTHCDIGNGNDALCTIGQASCNTPSCNTIYFKRYMDFLEPFLANQLKGDCNAGNQFMDSITFPSQNLKGRKIQGSIACSSTGIIEMNNHDYDVYPNPVLNNLTINFTNTENEMAQMEVYNSLGKKVLFTAVSKLNSTVSFGDLPNGIYIIRLLNKNNISTFKVQKIVN